MSKPNEIEEATQRHATALATEIAAIQRRQVLAALGGDTAGAVTATKAATAPAAKAAKAAPATKPKSTKSTSRAKGEKRDPAALQALVDETMAYIVGHPGEGVEQIAAGMSKTTKELTLPVKKLLKDKKITAKGKQRGTKYTAK